MGIAFVSRKTLRAVNVLLAYKCVKLQKFQMFVLAPSTRLMECADLDWRQLEIFFCDKSKVWFMCWAKSLKWWIVCSFQLFHELSRVSQQTKIFSSNFTSFQLESCSQQLKQFFRSEVLSWNFHWVNSSRHIPNLRRKSHEKVSRTVKKNGMLIWRINVQVPVRFKFSDFFRHASGVSVFLCAPSCFEFQLKRKYFLLIVMLVKLIMFLGWRFGSGGYESTTESLIVCFFVACSSWFIWTCFDDQVYFETRDFFFKLQSFLN